MGLAPGRDTIGFVAQTWAVRTFIAAWPTAAVREALSAIERSDDVPVKWVAAEQWHVTLAFMGQVDDAGCELATLALRDAAARLGTPALAELGPATADLGRSILMVPVAGLERVAAEVRIALATRGLWLDDRPFVGHLTLARSRRRQLPRHLIGLSVSARWMVDDLSVVASHNGPDGVAYEQVATVTLG